MIDTNVIISDLSFIQDLKDMEITGNIPLYVNAGNMPLYVNTGNMPV